MGVGGSPLRIIRSFILVDPILRHGIPRHSMNAIAPTTRAAIEMVDLHELSGKFDEGPFRLLNVFPSEHQKALYPGIRHRLYELRPLDALHHRRVPVVCFQVQLRAMDCETRDEPKGCN